MKYVKDIMSSPVVSVPVGTTVQEAAKEMAKMNISSIAVKENGNLRGLVTERDFSKKVVADSMDPKTTKVDDIMAIDLVTTGPETTIGEAATIMAEGSFRRLPIVEGESLIGIVTETDLELALREEAVEETKARVRDHYKFAAQIRRQEMRIDELKKIINTLEANLQ